jgi:hypothetical protein
MKTGSESELSLYFLLTCRLEWVEDGELGVGFLKFLKVRASPGARKGSHFIFLDARLEIHTRFRSVCALEAYHASTEKSAQPVNDPFQD